MSIDVKKIVQSMVHNEVTFSEGVGQMRFWTLAGIAIVCAITISGFKSPSKGDTGSTAGQITYIYTPTDPDKPIQGQLNPGTPMNQTEGANYFESVTGTDYDGYE